MTNKLMKNTIYQVSATVEIGEDCKAVVVLHDNFGLKDGASIPLRRNPEFILIEGVESGEVGPLNGHSII